VAGPVQTAMAARMRAVVPGGVDSNVRLEVADRVIARGEGARIWDADGNELIDYVLGQGPAFLGHANPRILARVTDEISRGMTFGAQTEIELLAAENLVAALGWPEMVRIGMTSTETVQAALRLARAETGRRLFVRFRGQYSGWLDNVLISPAGTTAAPASDGQLPEALDQSITIEWNDVAALVDVLDRQGHDIAAVITEPAMFNAGAIVPEPGYLEALRSECTARGIVLIIDETITGFRLGPQGAIGRFGVVPDLAVYGKAVAGGFPASVLAGPAALMSRFASGTNHSGTFNANVLSCAAIVAAMEEMAGGAVHAKVERTGGELMSAIRDLVASRGLPIQVRGLPAAFHLSFDDDRPVRCYNDLLRADADRYRSVVAAARDNGLWLTGRGIWYVSAAHDDTTTTQTLERLDRALDLAEGSAAS
jgi:glutamate-1-semialdehyde 2,1-aminomutase